MSIKIFCKNLKRTREKLGLSQDKAARLSNLPYSTYVKIESGYNDNPSLASIIKIADSFNVSIDELLERKFKTKKK